MIKGKWRRKSWDRQWCLKKLIRETAEQIRRAQCDGDKNTEKKNETSSVLAFPLCRSHRFP